MNDYYKNYINHISVLSLIIDNYLIHDITQMIIHLYHHLLFDHLTTTKIHPNLIDYVINQKSYKIKLSILAHLRWVHFDFCSKNNIQISDLCSNHHFHFTIITCKKIGHVHLSKPIIKINNQIEFDYDINN